MARPWRSPIRVTTSRSRTNSSADARARGAESALGDADRLLRALPDGLLALLSQLVRRVVLQDVEKVVVADLEDFRDDAHADGVALAEVEVDHDLPGHCASLMTGGRC